MDVSNYERKESCPQCGSKDNLARYKDGSSHCFGNECNYFEQPTDGQQGSLRKGQGKPKVLKDSIQGETRALSKRGINQATCKLFNYQIGTYQDKPVHICNIYDDKRTLIAQKLRLQNKDFRVIGDLSSKPLIGMHLWTGGRKLVITEGEIDMLSLSQAQGNKYPVVSLPNGVQSAVKVLLANLDYLKRFDEVILCFDSDDPGQTSAEACAKHLLGHIKIKLAKLPLKDANELLLAGREADLIKAIWNAQEYKPAGVLKIADILESCLTPPVKGDPWWCEELTRLTYGRRYGEIYTLGAGTGVGKTDFFTQQIAYDCIELNEPCAVFYMEMNPEEAAKRTAGKAQGKRFHLPDGSWETGELKDALTHPKLYENLHLYDANGVTDWESIQGVMLYYIGQGVKRFFIDHLTAMATGAEEDERTELERIMKGLYEIANRLGAMIHVISHLTTPDGKSHEEGGRVTIRQFKGSRAIGFWSFFMFGIERNQQADDEEDRHTSILRCLKDRLTGRSVGHTIPLGYNSDTGKMFEAETEFSNPFNEHPPDF
ncbi:toprim domain-containing protein [Pleionea sp. CnH1-48]|uniref:toprim domain-containing protein n=1 Tax=Pleionea sp. CnH1-48 TaxID=2954494 RepID=UPI00209779C5|nr:toprim domain-containing protein [Pleionea sp. CnH1-48]MCO7225757.1 toprim domain-containing protein [Pleionea sp. CnH1-48]